MGNVAQNYEVRIMSIIGLCVSDLLNVDSMRAIQWLNNIIEPYLLKLTELAQLKQVRFISLAFVFLFSFLFF